MPRQEVRNLLGTGILPFKRQRVPVLQIEANSYHSAIWWPFHRHFPIHTPLLGKTPLEEFLEEAPSTFSSLLPYLGPPNQLTTLTPKSSPQIKLLPFIEAAGECGPQLVHNPRPLSLIELKQIKVNLGGYSDNPDKYINTFQHLTLTYELTWKATMFIVGQTLSGKGNK